MSGHWASLWDLGLRWVTPYLLLPSPPWFQHHPGGQEALGVPVGRQEVTFLRGESKVIFYSLPGSGQSRGPTHSYSQSLTTGPGGPAWPVAPGRPC